MVWLSKSHEPKGSVGSNPTLAAICGCSSDGRAPASQAGCRGFEPRHPLHLFSAFSSLLFPNRFFTNGRYAHPRFEMTEETLKPPLNNICGYSSVGRVPAFQAGRRGFEPRYPLHPFLIHFYLLFRFSPALVSTHVPMLGKTRRSFQATPKSADIV